MDDDGFDDDGFDDDLDGTIYHRSYQSLPQLHLHPIHGHID